MNANNDLSFREIVLTPENASDKYLLEPPSERKLGGEEFNSHLQYGDIRIRVGERPVAYNLLDLYLKLGKKYPAEYELFISYDVWLIMHSISIIDIDKSSRIKQLGCQTLFPEEPRITILELFPQTKYIKQIEATSVNEADIEINGQAQIPSVNIPLASDVQPLKLGGKINLSSKTNIVGRLSFSVITPSILAVGHGDYQSEFVFNRVDTPINGDQLMIQTVLLPHDLEELTFKTRIYSTVTLYNLIPSKWKSEWIDLKCELKSE